jgi:murein DD-endopeptidase MepM/ murein hydrolase activator NlpD
VKKRHRRQGLLPLRLCFRAGRVGALLPLIIVLLIGCPAHAAGRPRPHPQTHYISLLYWPLDEPYRAVLAYPDDAWTWSRLGLNPSTGCPPYARRGYEQSFDFWRDPSLPAAEDWQQASEGRRWVACYRNHAGTDIAAGAGVPVYAVAEGTVEAAEAGQPGQGGAITITHQRIVERITYTFRVRYIHLEGILPLSGEAVREGQLIGWVADRGTNSHLHIEVTALWSGSGGEVVNPWGPVRLWIDDDADGRPDTAVGMTRANPRNGGLRLWAE